MPIKPGSKYYEVSSQLLEEKTVNLEQDTKSSCTLEQERVDALNKLQVIQAQIVDALINYKSIEHLEVKRKIELTKILELQIKLLMKNGKPKK